MEMSSFELWLEELQKICPSVAKVFFEQSIDVQRKIIELIARKHSFVLRSEYVRQKELYEQLFQKANLLELKIDDLTKTKMAPNDDHSA